MAAMNSGVDGGCLFEIAFAMLNVKSVLGRTAESIFFERSNKTEPKENRPNDGAPVL